MKISKKDKTEIRRNLEKILKAPAQKGDAFDIGLDFKSKNSKTTRRVRCLITFLQ